MSLARVRTLNYCIIYPKEYPQLVHTGQAVAWCISDQETAEVITVLFKHLKEKSPHMDITTLMTDDGKLIQSLIIINFPTDNTGWNAATQVFSKDIKHLLCHWHVHRFEVQ